MGEFLTYGFSGRVTEYRRKDRVKVSFDKVIVSKIYPRDVSDRRNNINLPDIDEDDLMSMIPLDIRVRRLETEHKVLMDLYRGAAPHDHVHTDLQA